jgi:predicted Zn-dependent protease with MMP-like domain
MDEARFEELVDEAINSLPEELQERLDNVDIVIADVPNKTQQSRADRSRGEILLGLYEGVPLTERTSNYSFVMPDKISIFKKNIEAMCHDDKETVEEIRRVVLHEIAHHFGIDDDRLEEMGRY